MWILISHLKRWSMVDYVYTAQKLKVARLKFSFFSKNTLVQIPFLESQKIQKYTLATNGIYTSVGLFQQKIQKYSTKVLYGMGLSISRALSYILMLHLRLTRLSSNVAENIVLMVQVFISYMRKPAGESSGIHMKYPCLAFVPPGSFARSTCSYTSQPNTFTRSNLGLRLYTSSYGLNVSV